MIRKLLPSILIASIIEAVFGGMILVSEYGPCGPNSVWGLIGPLAHMFPGLPVGLGVEAIGFSRPLVTTSVVVAQLAFWVFLVDRIRHRDRTKVKLAKEPKPRIRDLEN